METFVIRVWQATDPDGGTAPKLDSILRGVVEHVASGRSARFRSGEELLSLVASRLEPRDSAHLPHSNVIVPKAFPDASRPSA